MPRFLPVPWIQWRRFRVKGHVQEKESGRPIAGLLVAIYHNLIHFEIIPEQASPCTEGIPCSVKYIEFLGFITIPMLSMLTFAALLSILIYSKLRGLNEK